MSGVRISPILRAAYKGDAVRITCESSSGAPVWSKDGKPYLNRSIINYYDGDSEIIEIANLQSFHSGYYECMDGATRETDTLLLYVGGDLIKCIGLICCHLGKLLTFFL